MKFPVLTTLLIALVIDTVAQTDESWKVYDDSHVARVEVTIHPDTLAWIYENPESDLEHMATGRFINQWIDQVFDSIGFGLRGNTSRQSAKKSFKVSFNTFIKGRKLLGIEKLNLNGEHNDPSIARSKFCFDRWAEIGMVASRASHAEVYINGEYYGLYVSVEHIDEEFLQKRFADDDGNLWKCLYPADLVYKGDDPGNYDGAYELKTNESQNDNSQLIRLMKRLAQTPANVLPDTLEQLIEVHEVLKYLAMNTLLGSWDDYRSLMNNYYLYHEPSTGRFHIIPYDYDNTFGVDWFGVDWSAASPYDYPKVASGDRPLSDRLLEVPEWRNLYTRFLHYYITEVMPVGLWSNHPESIRTLLTPYALGDVYRTFDYGFTMDDFSESYGLSYSNQHVKKGIRQFVDDCTAGVWGQLSYVGSDPVAWASEASARYPAPGSMVTIETSVFYQPGVATVEVATRVNGGAVVYNHMEYSPLTGTKNVDDYYRWRADVGGFVAGDAVEWRIKVTGVDGKQRHWPRSSWYRLDVATAPTSLLVNELLASNSTSFADPQGDFDDWAELYNPTTLPVLLTGCYVTDNRDNPQKFRITQPNVVVEPLGYLIVWCDDDAGDPGVHTSFKLSADGEFFGLVAPDGQTWIDSVTFGVQATDISYGRLPNGTNGWDRMTPTPVAPNQGISIAERGSIASCVLSPNPLTDGQLKVRISLSGDGPLRLEVRDLGGTTVYRQEYGVVASGTHHLAVDLSSLKPGLYLVEAAVKNGRVHRKLVVF